MNKTLVDIYNNKLLKQLVTYDSNQLEAVVLLEKLNNNLLKKKNWIFFKNKKRKSNKGCLFLGWSWPGKINDYGFFLRKLSY